MPTLGTFGEAILITSLDMTPSPSAQVFLELSFDENIEKSSTTQKMAEKANVKKSKRVEKKEKKEKKRELAKQLRKEVSEGSVVSSRLIFE